MKCEICGEREAILELKQVVGDHESTFHICLECAKAQGLNQNIENLQNTFNSFLNNLSSKEEEILDIVCDECGTTLDDFNETGKLGCAHCYSHFFGHISAYLSENIDEIQHVGRYPRQLEGLKKRRIELESLNEKLEVALAKEEYEKAAKLRDKIFHLESL